MKNLNYVNYPNPCFVREEWECLNGKWDFEINDELLLPSTKLSGEILVPFCPESKLSGIEHKALIPRCYYSRKFHCKRSEKNVLLHFGAVDYCAEVYINGKFVGRHEGGYTPFAFDITKFVSEGENEIFLSVNDEKLYNQARGKQTTREYSFGCLYTRTTGIWQDVWLEYAEKERVKNFYVYPNVKECKVAIDLFVFGCGEYEIEVGFGGKTVGLAKGEIKNREQIEIALAEKHLWGVAQGNLYDMKIRFNQDVVYTYFGLREVAYEGYDFLLNGEKTFQRLVLDQGFNIEGIYTSPSVQFMQEDIDRSVRLGFNGARLHQKVFEPKFLYLCDKAGYMVWGEYASWGMDFSITDELTQYIKEWKEVIDRDFNHPAIITWCPLNEVWTEREKTRNLQCVKAIYDFTKTLDTTRPCVDVSGGHHCETTDLFDFHCYEEYDILKERLQKIENEDVLEVPNLYCEKDNIRYRKGIPLNISEFGGIAVAPKFAVVPTVNDGNSITADWGYGQGESDTDSFVKRYCDLVELIYQYEKISGFCYTQLYDVEQEINGFYFYERGDKLTEEQKDRIKAVNLKK